MSAPLLSQLLPAGVKSAELYADSPSVIALPAEHHFIARAVPKRQNEFISARHCARVAMEQLGQPPVVIGKGEKGEPLWPRGIVGSLTHCAGYRGAAVGFSMGVRSIGIDAEPHDVLPEGVLPAVSLDSEREWISQADPSVHWDRILFCAKESTYKAWFPLTHRWLGFEDARITFTVSEPGRRGEFTSELLVPGTTDVGEPLRELRGQWLVEQGLVIAAIVV